MSTSQDIYIYIGVEITYYYKVRLMGVESLPRERDVSSEILGFLSQVCLFSTRTRMRVVLLVSCSPPSLFNEKDTVEPPLAWMYGQPSTAVPGPWTVCGCSSLVKQTGVITAYNSPKPSPYIHSFILILISYFHIHADCLGASFTAMHPTPWSGI